MPSNNAVPVQREQVTKAVIALLKHVENVKKAREQEKGTTDLFDGDQMVQLVFTLKKIPDKTNVKPILINLPHSLYDDTTEICILTKDPQEEYKKLFADKKVQVSKVISITKLRKNYKQFEAKRKLCNSYDLFLADDRITSFLPRLLGRTFFEKKKQPIPIDISQGNIAERVQKVQKTTSLFFSGGACISIRIARSSFSKENVIENIMEGLKNIVEKVPRKWKNIQAVSIKTTDSIALPIYNSLPQQVTRIKAATQDSANTADHMEDEEDDEDFEDNMGGEEESEDDDDEGEEEDFDGEDDEEEEEVKPVVNGKANGLKRKEPEAAPAAKQAKTAQPQGKKAKVPTPQSTPVANKTEKKTPVNDKKTPQKPAATAAKVATPKAVTATPKVATPKAVTATKVATPKVATPKAVTATTPKTKSPATPAAKKVASRPNSAAKPQSSKKK